MKRNTVYTFVNGIRTKPGDSKNWTGKAVTATHVYHDKLQPKAEKIEYYTSALLRPLQQRARADKLIRCMSFYHGWDRIVAAHSNGADVVMDAMNRCPFRIKALHLISPAINADFDKNGLNDAINSGHVENLHVWIAGQDVALKLANTFLGRLLGYGTLGRVGPVNSKGGNVSIHVEPSFGHSTWFEESEFNQTMARIWHS